MLDMDHIWKSIWHLYLIEAKRHFLWQIACRISITNLVQNWNLPPTNQDMWCTRCRTQTLENIPHYIWSFPKSRNIWIWTIDLLEHATPNHKQDHLSLDNALIRVSIGVPLQTCHAISPFKYSEIIHGVAYWQIWKVRLTFCMEGIWVCQISIVNLI